MLDAGLAGGTGKRGWDQNKLLQCFVIAPSSPLLLSSTQSLPFYETASNDDERCRLEREGERAASDIAAVREGGKKRRRLSDSRSLSFLLPLARSAIHLTRVENNRERWKLGGQFPSLGGYWLLLTRLSLAMADDVGATSPRDFTLSS